MELGMHLMNKSYPLTAVVALTVSGKVIDKDLLEKAIAHCFVLLPYLRLRITKRAGNYWFFDPNDHTYPAVEMLETDNPEFYRSVVEEKLNRSISSSGPMMELTCVRQPQNSNAQIVLAFNHSLVDSMNIRIILDELLKFISGSSRLTDVAIASINSRPGGYPVEFKGVHRRKKLLNFMAHQMRGELKFKRYGSSNQIPADSTNATTSIRFTQHESRQLTVAAGRQGLSLNSVLNTAILLSTVQHLYGDRRNTDYRTIAFADLRPFTSPSTPNSTFGCLIAMARKTVSLSESDDIRSVARRVHRFTLASARNNDLYAYYHLAPSLTRMTLRLRASRMSTSALSFIGKLDLAPRYNDLALNNVEAFITSNALGPEISGFGKILHGRLGLDFNYMPSEVSNSTAIQIANSCKSIALSIV